MNIRPDMPRLIQNLALLGKTDEEIADHFGLTIQQYRDYLDKEPTCRDAAMGGKVEADGNVARALYERACGYSHEAVKIFCQDGEVIKVPFTERYPPDTGAAFLWLSNRHPSQWRNRKADGDNPATAEEIVRTMTKAMKEMADADNGVQ